MTDFKGLGILVTRPEEQAKNLCQLIQQQGGRAISFPMIDIVFSEHHSPQLLQIFADLARYHIAIFISANSVHGAMKLIKDHGGLPESLRIATVGKASAKVLKAYHYQSHIIPQTFNSEGLLAHQELQQIQDKRILIIRGEGGRERLAQGLRQRGALVDYAEVYQRVLPKKDTQSLLTQWAGGEIQMVVTSSNEGLQNLFTLVGELGRQWIQSTPLLLVSQRGMALAEELGCEQRILAENATDDAIMDAIKKWYHEQGKGNRI